MQLTDRLTPDVLRRTSAGYVAICVRAPRIGIRDYCAAEVGPLSYKFKPIALRPRCAVKGGERLNSATPTRRYCGSFKKEKPVKKIVIEGAKLDLTDADAVADAISTLQGQHEEEQTVKDKALADVATLTTDKATLEAKVTTLEQRLADAELTPAKLCEVARAWQQLVDQAEALGVTVAGDMDEAAIMKAAVTARLGDLAQGWNDAQVAASFETLTRDVTPPPAAAGDRVHNMTASAPVGDDLQKAIADARAEMIAELNGEKPAQKAA
jgi:hypothetical protein